MLHHVGASRPGGRSAVARTLARSLLASASLITLCAVPAGAQTAGPPPVRQSIDGNGVDLFLGTYNVDAPSVSMGNAENGMSYNWFWRGAGWSDGVGSGLWKNGTSYTVVVGTKADSFTLSGGVYVSTEANGSSLTFNSGTGVYTYTTSDGTVAHFSKPIAQAAYINNEGLITDLTSPSGAKLVFSHQSEVYCAQTKSNDPEICVREGTAYRLASVRNSFGYMVALNYESDLLDYTYPNHQAWGTRTGATMVNLAVSGSATPSMSMTFVASGGYSYGTATDPEGRTTVFRTNGPQMLGIQRPGSGSEEVTLSYSGGRVSSITTPVGTTSYSASDSSGVRTVTVTDTGSHNTVYTFDIAKQRMTSMTDQLSRTTSWDYDSDGRLIRITQPEGNKTEFDYDGRGNVTERREIAKSGSGLANIVTTAAYDSSCSNPVTCNRPSSTVDARGYTTNYSYDSTHGGVTAVTLPAATSGGTRPETRYGYTSLQAYFNIGGSIVASGEPVYRLTSTSTCQTGASCSGTSDEVKTTIGYGPQTTGTGNNLLPVSVSRGAGDASLTATTATTYDSVGNVLTIDGPLSGSADTTRIRYNANRETIGVTSPDPDGGGSAKPRAQRFTYDSKGRVTLVETGNVDSQSDGDWAGFVTSQQVATDYDAADRKVKQVLSAGGTDYQVTQYSYDSDGRLDCTALRMNSATWSSLPGACTLATTGTAGPDRITRNSYDSADQLTKVQTAYGTADQSDEATLTYSSNGRQATVTDAEANKTTYEYDGFDRLVKTRYPDTTQGAGTSSTTDYEEVTYDAGSNVTNRRLRDGQSIGYAYDRLNRLASKTTPGSVFQDWDLAYSYDLLGRVTGVVGDSWASRSFSYDALGRMTTEQNYSATSYHAYDVAGRQTRLTWSDSFYVDYDYNVTGEVTAIRENGATSGIGVLATYAYDNLGRRTAVTRGNGTSASYSYDAVSRLSSLGEDMSGSSYDFTHSFTYNPASQIASVTRSNDAYAWGGHYNVNRAYTNNGLNQVTAAGGISLGYDGRGNLNVSGGTSYTYTAENRLVTGPGSHFLVYEPGGDQLLQESDWATDTRFAWSGDRMISEIPASTWTIARRYVPGPGTDETVVWYEGSGTSDRRWLHADERGSIVAVSNASGSVTAVNSYDEYGIPASGNVGRFQYTGQAWLPDFGIYYYRARMYSPTLGRFMQGDPIGTKDGPNLYNYVGGDPINRIDPSGKKSKVYCTGSIIPQESCGGGSVNGLVTLGGSWVCSGCGQPTKTDSQGQILVTAPKWSFVPTSVAGFGGIEFLQPGVWGEGLGEEKCPAVSVGPIGTRGEVRAALTVYGGLKALQLSYQAQVAAQSRFSATQLYNGIGDAYRHFYWSFAMTRSLGAESAEAFGNAHEVSNPGPDNELAMDTYNNAMGRAFASDSRYSGMTPDVAAMIAIQQQCLRTIQ